MTVRRMAVSVPAGIAERFDERRRKNGYLNRSKAVSDAISMFASELSSERKTAIATLMFKVDGDRAGAELDRIRRHYSDVIHASVFVPSLNGNIEVLVLRGRQCVLTKLRQKVAGVKGVSRCRMQRVPLCAEK